MDKKRKFNNRGKDWRSEYYRERKKWLQVVRRLRERIARLKKDDKNDNEQPKAGGE